MKKLLGFLSLILLTSIIVLSSSSQIFAQEKYTIGGRGPAGGWIFYLSDKTHGMEAAERDLTDTTNWSNSPFVLTGASGKEIGTGKANTDAIIAVQKAGDYAAKACKDLVAGHTNDWFLPSKDELALMYNKIKGAGGFSSDSSYWSSSEDSEQKAWNQYFFNGGQHSITKNSNANVRCVRTF
ncbi:MAG: DUF1566 domain-containing protein [bacterium]